MNVNFERAEKAWSPLIGKFIVNFVVIEDSIHHIIGKHFNKLTAKEIKNINKFKVRLNAFKRIMSLYIFDKKAKKEFHKNIKEILSLYNTRNLLAHNALSFAFNLHNNGDLKSIGFQINGKKLETSLNYKELKEKIDQLKNARTKFSELTYIYYETEVKLIEQLSSQPLTQTQ